MYQLENSKINSQPIRSSQIYSSSGKKSGRLHWSQNRHNTTVWTDCRQGSSNQSQYCLCQRLHWKPILLECYLPTAADCLAPIKWVCFEPTVWPDTCCSVRRIRVLFATDKTYLIELFRHMQPLWDQRDKNYHNRDIKPKLWDKIGEKLNVAGKFWYNTNEVGYRHKISLILVHFMSEW